MDIAIIGIGLYPFGRHEGVSAIEMGVGAARGALADAGIGWEEVQLACAGSLEVLQPDTMNKWLGLTGIPFTTLYNGCATGGNMMAIAVGTDGELALGTPRALFGEAYNLYSVMPDGNTFVTVARGESEPVPTELIVVQNWTEVLKRLAPTDD